jgi:4-hydroxybenzoate polyprenyltransferase
MLATVRTYLEMIRFAHTVFALPFAFMGAMLAAGGIPPGPTLGWILVAMVAARSGAMGVNRLADRQFDARNPRTRERALPQGRISLPGARLFVGVSFALFLVAAWQLNTLSFLLAPVAIVIVSGYSYTKRFTVLSHVFLGLSLAVAPIGGWIAVTGRLALPPFVLSAAVLFWAAGFDIIYALLDVEFDRQAGLFSLPARFGIPAALWVTRLFHLLTLLGLAALVPLLDLGWIYQAGLALCGALLIYEHLLLARKGLAKVDVAFFNVNGILSIAMFLATLADLLLVR